MYFGVICQFPNLAAAAPEHDEKLKINKIKIAKLFPDVIAYIHNPLKQTQYISIPCENGRFLQGISLSLNAWMAYKSICSIQN